MTDIFKVMLWTVSEKVSKRSPLSMSRLNAVRFGLVSSGVN